MITPEPDLGPIIGEYRTFRMVEVTNRADRMETFKGWLWLVIGVIYAVIFLVVILGGLLIYGSAAKAAKLTPVIPECVELAQREGYPTDYLTRFQVAKAKLRMARLSDQDPLVKTCREAIKAARAANPTGGPP